MEPVQQDEDEIVDQLVKNATRTCHARFQTCIAALDGEHRNHLEIRFADLKLWADSLGALAPGKASLDWRLSGRPSDIFLVTSLLDMLAQFLEGYKIAAMEGGDIRILGEARQGIDQMTDNLAWIGSAIRRSGTRTRLQKADTFFEHDRTGKDKPQCDQLRAHLICVVKSRPTQSARSKDYSRDFRSMELHGIQNRLVEANLRRWHRFRYAQRHSDILRASQAAQKMPLLVVPESTTLDPAIELTDNSKPRVNATVAKQRNEVNDQCETHSTAGLSASAFGSEYQGLQGRHVRPAKSTMTRNSTITGFARFPKAKRSQMPRKTLLCPCCCQALPLEEAQDPDLWAKHMKNDISPYTCIVEECPFPNRFYVTRNEWREHVLRDHPPKWRCSCCTGTRPVFQSLSSFMAHLDEKHENQVSDASFPRIMAKSTFRPFGIASCPLCDIHGPVDSPELVEHVLGHIYDFSMYALPWRTIPQKSVKRPIRTFNDAAPVLDSNDDEATTQMRLFNHTRLLQWAEEFHEGQEGLTPAQRATIRDLDWDDYQATGGEDGTCAKMTDYFDRADIDYFEDDASSHRASSGAAHSASTRRLSAASIGGHSSRTQANSSLSDETEELALPETNVAHGGQSAPRKIVDTMSEPRLRDLDKTLEANRSSEEKILLRMLRENENSLGAMHKLTLGTIRDLGNVYWDQGKLEEAEEMLLRALRGYEEVLGKKHPSTLETIGGLGILYWKQGKLEEAEEMLLRALRGYEEVLGEKHTSTLETIRDLGSVYRAQGKMKEAEEMLLRALRGYEEVLGKKHPSTLETIRGLGILYWNQGKLEEAEEMLLRALRGYEEVLWKKHTSTLETIRDLGSVYREQGKMKEAEEMLLRALRGYEEVLGDKHTSTLETIRDLSSVYRAQGKMKEAEEMLLRALRGYEEVLVEKHPSTLRTIGGLGILYWKQGKLEEAEEMLLRALRGYEEVLGEKHTSTLETIRDLGNVYRAQGKMKEAEEMLLRALRGYEEALGKKHPSTLRTIGGLGILYWKQGKLEEAEEMLLRALRGYEEVLGEKHPSTLETIRDLGNVYRAQGKMKEAEEMLLRALRGYEEVLGKKHTSTLETIRDLSSVYRAQGKIKEAEEMYLRTAE